METERIIIEGADAIKHFHHATCISALKIEVLTGLRSSRGSVLKIVQEDFGITARTKKTALEQLLELYKQTYNKEYGTKTTND